MSHSQFHCTGRAYLDMHGLIFETSICYWQDQPGRGSEHKEPGAPGAGRGGGPGHATRCGGRAHETPRGERKRGGRGGVVRKARPPDPPAPHPRRGCPIARATPQVHEGHSTPAATACRNEGRGAAGPLPPPPHPTPPSRARPPRRPREPGRGPTGTRPHRGGAADAPSSARPSAHPRGAGDAGRRGHGGRPAGGRPGGPTRARESASERGARRGRMLGGEGGGPPVLPPRPARDDVGGQAAAAKQATDRGRGRPGEARHTRARPRGAADGERNEAGGRTERGTDGAGGGLRPRDTNATEPAVEAGVAARATARGMASKRPAGGGEASRPLGRTAGSHRQRPPSTGAVPRHTQDDRLASPATTHTHTRTPTHPRGGGGGRGERGAHPLTGPHAHRHLQPGAGSRPGRTLSRRVPAAPTQPSHAQPYCAPKAPQPRPPLRAPRALLHPGTPPADRGRETTPT